MTIKTGPSQTATRPITVRSQSYDEAANTVDIVYATPGAAFRYGYSEVLTISEDAIISTRLDAGAVNLIFDHTPYGSYAGNVIAHRIEGDQAIATVRLSVNPEHAGIVADIKAGVIRTVSVGYHIHEYEETHDGNEPLMTVTLWEPIEISLVSVPLDPLAQIRSAITSPAGLVRRTVTAAAPKSEKPSMTVRTNPKPKPAIRSADAAVTEAVDAVATEADVEVTPELEAAVEAAIVTAIDDATAVVVAAAAEEEADAEAAADPADATRAGSILDLCTRHGLSLAFATRHVKAGTTISAVRSAILDAIAARSAPVMSTARVTIVRDEKETIVRGIGEALVSRMTGVAPADIGRGYRQLSLIEMGRRMIGPEADNMSKSQVAGAMLSFRSGMHTTADFPALLGSAGQRTLRAEYDEAPRTWEPIVRQTTVTDFRTVERVAMGDAPSLELVAEGAEYAFGTVGEGREMYKLATYGKKLSISRQAIVNDDLGAFVRILTMFGRRSAQLEADLIYSILTAPRKMSDNKQLFHADHGNLLAVGLDVDGLSAARKLMRKQKGIDGGLIDVNAEFVIVGGDLETDLEKLLSPIMATVTGEVNPFAAGKLKPIVENRITGNQWFMAANPGSIDTIEIAYLDGEAGIQTETLDDPDRDGVTIKARLDVVAAPIDHRGLLKSTGA